MKTRLALTLALVAGTTAAMAAPRESVTFTSVTGNGRLATPFNTTVTHTFAGSDGGGAYNATHLTIAGALTSGFPTEAAILITPPGGAPFIARPVVPSGATVPAGAFVVPVSSFTTAGEWSFTFFELFDDGFTSTGTATGNTVDVTWSTITFTLDDGPAPTGYLPGSVENVTLSNVDVDGLVATPLTRTFDIASTTPVSIIRLSGVGTARSVSSTSNLNANPTGRATFQLVAPDGTTVSTTGTMMATSVASSAAGSVTLSFPTPVNPAGTWTLRSYNSSTDNTGIDSTFPTLMVSLISPPATAGSLTPVDNTTVSASGTLAAGGVTWFELTLPAVPATSALDLTLDGTALAPVNDASLALYRANGVLEDSDDNDGAGLLGLLNYGGGRRFSPTGIVLNGRDGTLTTAGTYYAAVCSSAVATFGAGYGASTTGLNAGPVTLNATYLATAPAPSNPIASTITVTNDGAWNSAVTNIANVGDIAWFTFTTPADLTATGAVDIDFTGTNLSPVNDTDAGVYTATGTSVDPDEDDGTDLLSQFSYGAAGVRRNPTGNGASFRGQDGTVAGGTGNLAANTQYYIAVVGGNAGTHGSTFNAASGAAANTGSVTARVRAWSANAPTEIPTPPPATDLGRIGTVPIGSDGVITRTIGVTGPGQLNWFKFATGADLTTAGTNYMDIDTEGTQPTQTAASNGSLQDTEIGVYTSAGALVNDDDDSGSNQRSLLSFGSNVSRPAVVTPGSPAGLARTGQDTPVGGLLAGTYYIAVGNFDVVFVTNFEVTTTNTVATAGDIVLNFRTNLPGGCGFSDVASAGQVLGADGELTADDIIVFIGWFFTTDTRADIAGAGQTVGADGQFTADDIILFINRFFAGC
jgi:hypothetical protein